MKNQKPSVFDMVGLPQDPKGEGLFGSTLSRLKVCLLELKMISKQPLNSSKTTFKNPRKRVFHPENCQNDPLRGPNFDLKY